MPVLIAVSFLIIVPSLSFILRDIFAISFPARSLIIGVLGSWVVLVTSRFWFSDRLIPIPYGSQSIPLTNLGLTFDWVSWSFSTATITILLVYALTKGHSSADLASLMLITGVGTLSLFSANGITFLLSWALLDVIWLTVAFQDPVSPLRKDEAISPYLMLLIGPFLLLIASFPLTEAGQMIPGREDLSPSLLLVAAGFFRLAILYFSPRSYPGQERDPSTRWLFSLGSISLGLLLITRGAQLAGDLPAAGIQFVLSLIILVTGLTALFIENEHQFRGWWTLGVFFSALQGVIYQQPEVSAAWAVAYIIPGSLLYLKDKKGGVSYLMLTAAAVGFLGLPYTPLSINGLIYTADGSGWLAALGTGVLGGAYLKQLLINSADSKDISGEETFFTAAVSLLLIGIHYLLSISGMRARNILSWKGEVILFLPPVCAAGLVWFTYRFRFNIRPVIDWFNYAKGIIDLFAGFIQFLIGMSSWMVEVVTDLLEGRGGLIWALLGAILMLSLLITQGGNP